MINKLAIAVALVLGGIAVLISKAHVSAIRRQEEAVALVMVTMDLKAGTRPGPNLGMHFLPEMFIEGVSTAVHWKDRQLVSTSQLIRDVKKGSFLLWSDFGGDGRESARALLDVLEPGKRAIALPIPWMQAVGGHVQPGDYVDILATMTIMDRDNKPQEVTVTMEQALKILATEGQTSYNQEIISGKANRNQYQSVVLEATPIQCQMLAFAFHSGKNLSMVLRRPDDQLKLQIPKMNWSNLSQQGGVDLPDR